MTKMKVINLNQHGEEIDLTTVKIPKDHRIYDVLKDMDNKYESNLSEKLKDT